LLSLCQVRRLELFTDDEVAGVPPPSIAFEVVAMLLAYVGRGPAGL
jgi:hypothetical protein